MSMTKIVMVATSPVPRQISDKDPRFGGGPTNFFEFKTKKYSKEHYGKRHKKGQSCDGGKGEQDKRFPHER